MAFLQRRDEVIYHLEDGELGDPQLLQEAPFVKNGQRGVDICKVDFQ
jgi:hypothetical protein